MWNNIESLKSLSHNLLLVAGLFGVLSIAAGTIRYYADRRVSELTSIARLADEANRLSAQQAAIEQERIERLRLESKFAPRRLSTQQKATLIAALKPFSGQTISIICLQDEESLQFAKDFSKMFSEAGWSKHNTGINQIGLYSNLTFPRGIVVLLKNEKNALSGEIQEANNALGKALISAGLASGENLFMKNSLPPIGEGNVLLWIGRKPD